MFLKFRVLLLATAFSGLILSNGCLLFVGTEHEMVIEEEPETMEIREGKVSRTE